MSKRYMGTTGDQLRTRQFHNGSDGALSHAVELMHMGGGQVEVHTPLAARNLVNSLNKNSPALSLCRVPTARLGVPPSLFRRSLNDTEKRQMCAGASDLFFSKWTALKRM
eukprot:6176225-Pleurochrysis_carterae.AAC.5